MIFHSTCSGIKRVVAATYIIKSLATASRAILFFPGVFMIETVWQIMKWVMKWILANYEMGPGKL